MYFKNNAINMISIQMLLMTKKNIFYGAMQFVLLQLTYDPTIVCAY